MDQNKGQQGPPDQQGQNGQSRQSTSVLTPEERVLKGQDHVEFLEKEIDKLGGKKGEPGSGRGEGGEIGEELDRIREGRPPSVGTRPTVRVRAVWLWTILAIYVFFSLFILTISAVFLYYGGELGFGLPLRLVGLVGFIVVLGHLIPSIATFFYKKLDVHEAGMLTFLGMPVHRFNLYNFYNYAGPVILLWGLFKLVIEPRPIYNEEYPGPAERIRRFKVEQDEVYGPGDVRPMLVTTGPPTTEERRILNALFAAGLVSEEVPELLRQNNVDIRLFVQWRVGDLPTYLSANPGETPEERREEAKKWIHRLAETELKETLRNLTPSTVIQCWGEVSKRTALRLRKVCLERGIWIDRAGLNEQNLSHETHQKLTGITRAGLDRHTTAITAQATKQKLILEGEGSGAALEAEGKGRAAAELAALEARAMGLRRIAEELDMPEKQVVLLAELAETIASGANYALYGGKHGVEDLMKTVTAIKAQPSEPGKKSKSPTTPPPPTPPATGSGTGT